MTTHCPYCAEEIQVDAVKCKHCLTWLPGGAQRTAEVTFGSFGQSKHQGAPIRRPRNDRIVWGVCAGFGRGLGIDPMWVRIAYALTTFFTALVPGVVLYMILAAVIPTDEDLHAEV
jgi:phage shock protein PspC (stress-responsive transcriptional regulator)